ncbi:MAG: prepilin-type N-terminal cleavage/methylation domain-containing protein [Desulfobacterales bacterium]|nr:prepilin-type N-terminal cleavage/methylation domain-containing protein [Desulfobacterales bacterium]
MNNLSKAIRPDHNGNLRRQGLSRAGFTMLELMIAMALSTMVLGGIYAAHRTQSEIYRTQIQVSDLQQNIRGAMFIMSREIRMAGYNPTGKAKPGILYAGPDAIQFTFDVTNADGEPNTPDSDTDDVLEDITYWVGENQLIRKAKFESDDDYPPERNEPVALGVDVISFAYAYDADLDGQVETSEGEVIWAFDSDDDQYLDTTIDSSAVNPIVHINRIRMVRVWLLVKTRHPVLRSPGPVNYTVGHQGVERNDAYRRQLASMKIVCRNLHL